MFNKKKSFFDKKIKQVQNALWDLEFKLFKVRDLREERRKQHDRTVEAIDALEAKLKAENTEEVKVTLTAQLDESKKYHEQLLNQMKALDDEVNGIPATETTEEYNGVLKQIEAHRELIEMYTEYKNSL